MMFNTPPVILPHVRSGRMKGLAVASVKRIPAAPELPTVAEAGVPGFELSTWYGVMVPAGPRRMSYRSCTKRSSRLSKRPT